MTTMRDGAPHGYSVFSFDGNQYSIEFRAARRPIDYQMNIIAPEFLPAADVDGTIIYANVFGGSELSDVMYSFAGGPWTPMLRVDEADPMYVKAYERDKDLKAPFRPLPGAVRSTHLWRAPMLNGMPPGVYPIHVKTTDMFGQTYIATRAIRVE